MTLRVVVLPSLADEMEEFDRRTRTFITVEPSRGRNRRQPRPRPILSVVAAGWDLVRHRPEARDR